MKDAERQIYLLDVTDDSSPFEKWYSSIRDKFARSVILAKVTRLSDPDFSGFKSVGAGVYELRVFLGPGYRIYLGLKGDRLVILLGGGDKRTQWEDINEAKRLWKKFKDETPKNIRKFPIR